MNPIETGQRYDKIAHWWHDQHVDSNYGTKQIEKALPFCPEGGQALDVGCGAGGRFIRMLEKRHFSITGIDVSSEMIALATANHPDQTFLQQDICAWETDDKFDLIIAWDSIFHLPFAMQKPVMTKLCRMLARGGVLAYTFGDAHGDKTDSWHGDTFYYSSIGINENLQLLIDNGLTISHLELDQYPQPHVYAIATRR